MKFPAFEPIQLFGNNGQLELSELKLNTVIPDENQPRRNFDNESLNELAMSISEHGILQPIIVKSLDDKRYQIIAGERRWRASKMAGLNSIPAVVKGNDKYDNLGIQIIENIQRKELNILELAKALSKLFNEYSLSHDEIGRIVGKSRTTVTNLLRLLNLSPHVQNLLTAGKIEMGHARAVLSLCNEEQDFISDNVVARKMSVREVEVMVKNLPFHKNIEREGRVYSKEIDLWSSKLSRVLSKKVGVKINRRGVGRVEIYFSSPEEVETLIEELSELTTV